ncbi:MAG: hypothetical protein P8J84_01875 [Paracoccaceae bacterium]|nr:hypothetical protein [Paracoccaceae bacterium]
MKNALIIVGLSIALVVGGGVVYTFMSAQKDPAIITKKNSRSKSSDQTISSSQSRLQSGGGFSPAGKSYHGHGNDHRNCGV